MPQFCGFRIRILFLPRFDSNRFEPIRIALVWLKLRWVLCFINFHGNGTYIPIYIYRVKTYIHSESELSMTSLALRSRHGRHGQQPHNLEKFKRAHLSAANSPMMPPLYHTMAYTILHTRCGCCPCRTDHTIYTIYTKL